MLFLLSTILNGVVFVLPLPPFHPSILVNYLLNKLFFQSTFYKNCSFICPTHRTCQIIVSFGLCFIQDLDDLVEAALLYYGEKKALDNTPLPLALEKDNDPRLLTSPLRFPGKLAIDVLNNRLFISDSNHNRIVCKLLSSSLVFSGILE